jgi:hypothetical protein
MIRLSRAFSGAAREAALLEALDALPNAQLYNAELITALAEFAQIAPPERFADIINTALRLIFYFPYTTLTVKSFVPLIPLLPEETTVAGFKALMDAAQRDRVLDGQGGYKPNPRALPELLDVIARHLPDSMRATAEAAIQAIPDPAWRLISLVWLFPKLDHDRQAAAQVEILEMLQTGKYDVAASDLESFQAALVMSLAALLPHVSGEIRAVVENHAIAGARSCTTRGFAGTLTAVALAVNPPLRTELISEALANANPFDKLEILKGLPAPDCWHLLLEVIDDVIQWKPGGAGRHELLTLATEAVVEAPPEVQSEAWQIISSRLGHHKRSELAADLQRLGPLIERVASDAALEALAKNVLRVHAWWP